ncbi:MAG: hypothetical protein VYD96_09825 [Pseudomonadota bacterium]|nr:hypothetical protein [Pseudomonadota bacterium]
MMLTFEYLVAFSSIIVGLAIAKLLHALPSIFNKNSFSLTHSLLFIATLFDCVSWWWGSLGFKIIEVWTGALFILYIAPFIGLYVVSDLLSSANPENIQSWKNHYFEIRFKLWLTQIVIFTFAMIQAFVYTTYFENTEILLIFIAWFAMIVVAITSKKEKTHLVISILYFLFIIMLVINDLEDENSLAEFWRLPS